MASRWRYGVGGGGDGVGDECNVVSREQTWKATATATAITAATARRRRRRRRRGRRHERTKNQQTGLGGRVRKYTNYCTILTHIHSTPMHTHTHTHHIGTYTADLHTILHGLFGQSMAACPDRKGARGLPVRRDAPCTVIKR